MNVKLSSSVYRLSLSSRLSGMLPVTLFLVGYACSLGIGAVSYWLYIHYFGANALSIFWMSIAIQVVLLLSSLVYAVGIFRSKLLSKNTKRQRSIKVLPANSSRLEVMEEARRKMFVNIAHDLRSPVNSALSNTELLLNGIIDSPQQEQIYLKEIRSKLLGLTRLVQDIFQLSQIECLEMNFQMGEIRLQELISIIYDKYILDVENAGLELKLEATIPANITVYADVDRINQVFSNLIANSVRQTEEGGRITINCELAVARSAVPDANGDIKYILF